MSSLLAGPHPLGVPVVGGYADAARRGVSYVISPAMRDVLRFLEALAVERMCDNEADSGLSTDRAIMRVGPGAELSPPAGSASPHEAKS